jgi:hypothetical protein
MKPWDMNSSATVSVSPSGLLDITGVSWRTVGSAIREFTIPPASPEIIFEVDLETGSLSASSAVSCILGSTAPGGGDVRLSSTDTFSTWIIIGAGTSVTTIPATDPVRFQVRYNNGANFTATVTPLLGGTPHVYNGTFDNSGTGDEIDILNISGSGGADLYFNRIILDETGTLPVELSGFSLE